MQETLVQSENFSDKISPLTYDFMTKNFTLATPLFVALPL
jgi:hypothetical protein